MSQLKEIHLTGKIMVKWIDESNGDSLKLTKKLQTKIEFSPKSLVWCVKLQ